MKLEQNTIKVLKNFATINSNLLVREGNVLSTVSNKKNVFSRAVLTQNFDKEFAIYDLNNLLAVLSVVQDADIHLGDDFLTVKDSGTALVYRYADKNIIVSPPDKNIEVDRFTSFEITEAQLEKIMRSAAVLAAPSLTIASDGEKIVGKVSDPDVPTSNSFTMDLGVATEKFTAVLNIENLKLIPGDYTVGVSKKKVLHFSNKNCAIEYWLATEKGTEI